MEKIRSFNDNIDVKNKRVILRSDFNVPISNGSIQDKTRIDLSIPFIQNLLKREAKVLLISHLGRPKDEKDKSLSLMPVYKYLREKAALIGSDEWTAMAPFTSGIFAIDNLITGKRGGYRGQDRGRTKEQEAAFAKAIEF